MAARQGPRASAPFFVGITIDVSINWISLVYQVRWFSNSTQLSWLQRLAGWADPDRHQSHPSWKIHVSRFYRNSRRERTQEPPWAGRSRIPTRTSPGRVLPFGGPLLACVTIAPCSSRVPGPFHRSENGLRVTRQFLPRPPAWSLPQL